MTTLTADAQQLYDRYLQTVRWSVRGVADANEIERDVREHVDTAIAQAEEPVTSNTLRDILSRLGDPWQWIPLDELPLWRRALMRFWLGPDDWRLAYLCFGLMVTGLVLLPVGIGFFLLIGAYLLARATCEVAADRDGTLGPRRWLIYPPLVFFGAIFLGSILIGPAAPALAWGIGDNGYISTFHPVRFNFSDPVALATFVAATGAITLGIWWVALSGLIAVLIRPFRFLFAPFANGFRRVHALWLTAIGLLSMAAGAATLYYY